MDVIKQYVNNMFKNLPSTYEVNELKAEILENMEEKYRELKTQGKSDSEAIGIIVTDFGDIDDLIKGLDLKIVQPLDKDMQHDYNNSQSGNYENYNEETYNKKNYSQSNDNKRNYNSQGYSEPNYNRQYQNNTYRRSKAVYKLPEVSLEEAQQYISTKTDMSYFTASGVAIILVGVAIFLILIEWFETALVFNILPSSVIESAPVVILLIMIAVAVGLFIYAGNHLEPFKYIEDNKFFIYRSVCEKINMDYMDIKSTMDMRSIIGIVLCVVSPIGVFSDSVYGVSFLLIIVAIGVFLIVHSSNVTAAYKKLLYSKNIDEE